MRDTYPNGESFVKVVTCKVEMLVVYEFRY